MNTFIDKETAAAHQLYLDASALALLARNKAGDYASPEDRDAATVALLVRALELAGGHQHIKPQGDQN